MQKVIEFESSVRQQPIDVRATIQRKLKSLNLWLDSKSEFYSRICEFSVTRRLVIRVNLVTLCVGLAAIAIEQQPITSVVSPSVQAGSSIAPTKQIRKEVKNERINYSRDGN